MRIYLFGIFIILFSACNNNSPESATPSSKPSEDGSSDTGEVSTERKVVLFFGNSLTAGYGVDAEQRFTSLIQEKIDSLNYPYQVVNAGVSGETTASGNSRLDWVIKQQDVDVFVLELGANDGLRGIPTDETRENLLEMIDKVRKNEPGVKILLTGMMVPPNMGPDYSQSFMQIFPEVADQKNTNLMPFLLKDVAGETELNLEDGIHPNEKGHRIVAENLWPYIAELLEKGE